MAEGEREWELRGESCGRVGVGVAGRSGGFGRVGDREESEKIVKSGLCHYQVRTEAKNLNAHRYLFDTSTTEETTSTLSARMRDKQPSWRSEDGSGRRAKHFRTCN